MKISRKLSMGLVTWGILVGALIAAAYFYQQNQDLRNHPEKVSQHELATLLVTVGRLIELPQGEEPQLATVTDAAKLKNEQQFFAKAENGDKILIYQQAKKAIVFRPATGKIIEVGPITVAEALATPTPIPTLTTKSSTPPTTTSPSSPAPINLVLLNGTAIVGLTSQPETKLTQAVPELNIQSKDIAKKRDYPKTLVVDVTNHPASAAQVANVLGATVGSLPADEVVPSGADILVIIGLDQQK